MNRGCCDLLEFEGGTCNLLGLARFGVFFRVSISLGSISKGFFFQHLLGFDYCSFSGLIFLIIFLGYCG